MGYWDYYKGTLRDYHRDPFPHSVLRTREPTEFAPKGQKKDRSARFVPRMVVLTAQQPWLHLEASARRCNHASRSSSEI